MQDQEKQIADVSGTEKRQYDGAILTASPGMKVVTPFTTLIHSEMMFNPPKVMMQNKQKHH
ncbi:hypothetical protein O9992_21940 [Vibrio lentus]|nr:hypothetical protein [Vibrio lentus]